MLRVYLGNMEQAIYHPPTYFDNQYEDEWITDNLSVEMIKDVDKSEAVSYTHLDVYKRQDGVRWMNFLGRKR